MNNCMPVLYPTSIVETDGIIQISVPMNTVNPLPEGCNYAISLTKSIPNTSRCNRVQVIYGTCVKDVFCGSQYYRTEKLPCDKEMVLCNGYDPETVDKFIGYRCPKRRCN